jgi:hypothetical protein
MIGRAAALASRPCFAMLLAALSALLPVPAGADGLGGLALGAGLEVGAALARSPYDPANAQSWLSARLLLEAPLVGVLGLGFSLGYHLADESDPVTGVLYRGHKGLEAAAYLLFRPVLAADQPKARVGFIAGSTANFDMYDRTELLFFYPSLAAELYLELPIEGPPGHTFSLGLPFRLDFRKDLDLSASVCLGLRWRWYPKWKREILR